MGSLSSPELVALSLKKSHKLDSFRPYRNVTPYAYIVKVPFTVIWIPGIICYCADLNVNVTGKSRDKPTSLSWFYFQPRVIGLYYSLANRKKEERKNGFRFKLKRGGNVRN